LAQSWIQELVAIEEKERARRSLKRRIRNAKVARLKPLRDFDRSWPRKIDCELVEDLLRLDFLGEAANIVLIGPSGVGKTTIAQNLAHEASAARRALHAGERDAGRAIERRRPFGARAAVARRSDFPALSRPSTCRR
jgi:DNA replication protein DnaC